MEGWAEFINDMRNYYNVNMDCLSEPFRAEQKDYYLHTSQWTDVHPSQLLGPPAIFKRMDLLNVSVDELKVQLRSCCLCC